MARKSDPGGRQNLQFIFFKKVTWYVHVAHHVCNFLAILPKFENLYRIYVTGITPCKKYKVMTRATKMTRAAPEKQLFLFEWPNNNSYIIIILFIMIIY